MRLTASVSTAALTATSLITATDLSIGGSLVIAAIMGVLCGVLLWGGE